MDAFVYKDGLAGKPASIPATGTIKEALERGWIGLPLGFLSQKDNTFHPFLRRGMLQCPPTMPMIPGARVLLRKVITDSSSTAEGALEKCWYGCQFRAILCPVLKMKALLSRRESAFPIQTVVFFLEAVLSLRHVIVGQMDFAGFVFPEQCKQKSYKGYLSCPECKIMMYTLNKDVSPSFHQLP